MSRLMIDEELLDAVIEGTVAGLSMSGVDPEPIGASRNLSAGRPYSVLVSLGGDRNGTVTLNFADATVRFLVAQMFGEELIEELDDEAFDAVCEIGNIVAGRIKSLLQGTQWAFQTISLPALVVGANYNLHHYRGLTTVAVEFCINEIPAHRKERYFTAAVTLMDASGQPRT